MFLALIADLTRVHWDHFYLFPRDFYRTPPATAAVLDAASGPYWRLNHYLEYPGDQMWQMHNDPVKHFALLEREKASLSCGIHAVFGYRHVSAHLPLMWGWDASLSPAGKSGRYLLSNRGLNAYQGDSLRFAARFGEISVYETKDWKPRLETLRRNNPADLVGHAELEDLNPAKTCPTGFSAWRDLCAHEPRDGSLKVLGSWKPGDTLLFRERFDAGWQVRLEKGSWQKPRETGSRFQAVVFEASAEQVEWRYHPEGFLRMAGFSLGLGALGLGLFGFLGRRIRSIHGSRGSGRDGRGGN